MSIFSNPGIPVLQEEDQMRFGQDEPVMVRTPEPDSGVNNPQEQPRFINVDVSRPQSLQTGQQPFMGLGGIKPQFLGNSQEYNLYSNPRQSHDQGTNEKTVTSRSEKWSEPGIVQSFADFLKDTDQTDWSNESVRKNAILNYLRTPTELDDKAINRRAFAQAMSDVGRLIAQGHFAKGGAHAQPIQDRAGKLVDKAEQFAMVNQKTEQDYANQKTKLLQSLDKMSEDQRKQYNLYKRDIQKAFKKTVENKQVLSREDYDKLSTEDKYEWRLNADGKSANRVSGGSRSQDNVYAGYSTGRIVDGKEEFATFTNAEAPIANALARRILSSSPKINEEFQSIREQIGVDPQGNLSRQALDWIFDAAYLRDRAVYRDVMRGYVDIPDDVLPSTHNIPKTVAPNYNHSLREDVKGRSQRPKMKR